jgi:hypothetical protein
MKLVGELAGEEMVRPYGCSGWGFRAGMAEVNSAEAHGEDLRAFGHGVLLKNAVWVRCCVQLREILPPRDRGWVTIPSDASGG